MSERVAVELQAIPQDQATCLIHRFYAGLSLAETAAVMGKKVGAIKQLQYRGIKALGKRLPDLDPLDGFAPAVRAVSHSPQDSPQEVRR